jgi:hypothetical protein
MIRHLAERTGVARNDGPRTSQPVHGPRPQTSRRDSLTALRRGAQRSGDGDRIVRYLHHDAATGSVHRLPHVAVMLALAHALQRRSARSAAPRPVPAQPRSQRFGEARASIAAVRLRASPYEMQTRACRGAPEPCVLPARQGSKPVLKHWIVEIIGRETHEATARHRKPSHPRRAVTYIPQHAYREQAIGDHIDGITFNRV